MNLHFEFADKRELETTLPVLFSILYDNMQCILPSVKSYDEEYADWFSSVFPAMQKAPRQIVLMYNSECIIGFFQYFVNNRRFRMEEIQLAKAYHSTGVFTAFYRWLLPRLPADIMTVDAFAHRDNAKSQKILEHLGLSHLPDGDSGDFLYYNGNFHLLLGKYT